MPPAPLRHTQRHRTATRAVPRPQQAPPTPLGAATALPKHRCSGSSRERTTLACGPLPAPVPDSYHLTPPSKPAGGSLLPSPRPLQRAAQQRHHRWLYTVSAFHQSHSSSIMSDVGAQGLDQLGDNSRAWGSSGTSIASRKFGGGTKVSPSTSASLPRAHQQRAPTRLRVQRDVPISDAQSSAAPGSRPLL